MITYQNHSSETMQYLAQEFDQTGKQIGQHPFNAESLDEARTYVEAKGEGWQLAVIGETITLPGRNGKAFQALPKLAQEFLHAAHRIQFQLRTGKGLSEYRKAGLRQSLLRALELAEASILDALAW